MHSPSPLLAREQLKYISVILVYDYALTFGDECRYIWCFSRGRVTVVYWLTRYVSLGLVSSPYALNMT